MLAVLSSVIERQCIAYNGKCHDFMVPVNRNVRFYYAHNSVTCVHRLVGRIKCEKSISPTNKNRRFSLFMCKRWINKMHKQMWKMWFRYHFDVTRSHKGPCKYYNSCLWAFVVHLWIYDELIHGHRSSLVGQREIRESKCTFCWSRLCILRFYRTTKTFHNGLEHWIRAAKIGRIHKIIDESTTTNWVHGIILLRFREIIRAASLKLWIWRLGQAWNIIPTY